ncbi:MAG: polysaccharide biosynthesis tyrosine autokinase, partial [Planctomycetes bacterium]|nr:polysaccharide biosynthesis tyrosine autokinase [Planctomycetota bacterium]
MAHYELNLRDYSRILRKRKPIIIFSTIMLGIMSYFFASTMKPVPLYKTTTSVKVESASMVTGLFIEALTWSDNDALETQSALITSIPVIEQVAKEIGLIDKDVTSEGVRNNPELLRKVLNLKGKLSTSVEDDTYIINISAVSDDPEFSQLLANTTAHVFQQENMKKSNKQNFEAKRFIEKRLEIVGNKLKDAQEKLKTLKQEKRFVTMDTYTSETIRKLEESEQIHKEARGNLNDIDLLIQHLNAQKSLPEESVKGLYEKDINPIFLTLNSKLVDLQTKKDILLLDYTINHPEVKRIDVEIVNTTEIMLKKLLAEKTKIIEIVATTSKEMENQTAVYRSLPEISFILSEIENNIDSNQKLYTELEIKHQEVLIKEAEQIQEIIIVSPALEPHSPINPPSIIVKTIVGSIIGLVFGVVMAFVRETLDTSIGTIEEVEEFLHIPVLGIIPYMGIEEIKSILSGMKNIRQPEDVLNMNARLVSHFAPKSTMAESYRALRTGLEFIIKEQNLKCITFTSSGAGEGKSTVTCNFAMMAAQIGKKVLLIDGDLRKPTVNKIFGINKEPGLSDVILGNYHWNEVIKTDTDIMMGEMGMEDITTVAPGINNLNIITAGLSAPNTAEILHSSKMDEIISQVREAYDLVVFDCSPVLPSTDAVILSAKVDAVTMVYQVGKVARGALRRAKSQIDNAKVDVVGVVLNCLKPES